MSSRQPHFHLDSGSANSSPRPSDTFESELPITHPHHHAHAQSQFDMPSMKMRSPTNDRNASVDYSSSSNSGSSIPPLGSQTKKRTNIMPAPSGILTPLNPSNSPLPRTVDRRHPINEESPTPTNSLARSPSSGDLASLPTHAAATVGSQNGPQSDRDRTPVERKPLNSSASMRSLSPLRGRPSIMTGPGGGGGGGGGSVTTKSSSRVATDATTTNPTSQLATFAHLSIHSSPITLLPSTTPNQVTSLPQTTGIVVALHVSGELFLTTPETLLRVTQLEGRASANDTSLLQWIGEDVLLKHREVTSDAVRSPTSNRGGGAGGGADSPLGMGSMQSKRRPVPGGDQSSEPSPRSFPPPAFTTSNYSSTVNAVPTISSSVHTGPSLPFHAPTYSYFLDRNPLSYSLILDYLRDGAGLMKERIRNVTDSATLHALAVEAEHFGLGVLGALVQSELLKRSQHRLLSEDDLFWQDVVQRIDLLFPNDSLAAVPISNATPASPKGSGPSSPRTSTSVSHVSSSPLTSRGNLQKNIGNMLRRLAFQRDPMLRVAHATYRHSLEYEDRLLEILHTSCTLCQRKIYFRPIGLREGRESGCPVHPPSGQWDRKARQWTCCGNPEFQSGCQFTGVHYTLWTFLNSD